MERKTRKRLLITSVIIGILFIVGGILWYRWPYKEYQGLKMRTDWDVSDNIVNAPGNKIFGSALANLGYTTFLHETGPYTVFVPTDKAYDNLPLLTKNFLINPANSGSTRQVLLYHIVRGKYLYSDLREGMTLQTVEGENLTFSRKNGFWVINNYAYIEKYDALSKNGVIHVVTNYLIPPSMVRKKK